MDKEILATIEPSIARRWVGIVMLAALGGLSIYVALASSPALSWQMFLLVVGTTTIFLASRLWRATETALELTETELRERGGQIIVKIDDIESLDRGVFAFKPSNGFLIKAKTNGPRGWRPGLWWRIGRRIGIGGVVSPAQTKMVSEIISAMLMQRQQDVSD
ncbi:hypothetical protein ACXYMO_04650 [Arenibacterium sp. CAU 1754]